MGLKLLHFIFRKKKRLNFRMQVETIIGSPPDSIQTPKSTTFKFYYLIKKIFKLIKLIYLSNKLRIKSPISNWFDFK